MSRQIKSPMISKPLVHVAVMADTRGSTCDITTRQSFFRLKINQFVDSYSAETRLLRK